MLSTHLEVKTQKHSYFGQSAKIYVKQVLHIGSLKIHYKDDKFCSISVAPCPD